jgi:HTH-type transcriptional regulator, sugar sensing transcriptional regulator
VAGLDELIQRLQALGFSQYEARAYCALLQKAPANGHEVAKTAGIPTSKVYETLERLRTKGAVLVQRSEPTLWAPVPHRDLLGRLRQDMESTFSAVEQGLAQLGYEQDTALTWSLSGRGHVVDSMRRAIERARERLAGAIPAAALDELAPALRAAAERGVAVEVVIGADELPGGDGIRVRRRPDGGPDGERLALVVGDGEETVLADFGRDRPEGMWTHHPAIALLAAEHLRELGRPPA